MNPFCLDLFSFFNAHDSRVLSFDGVDEFLHTRFGGLELINSSSVFPLISVLSSGSEIQSSACSSLLEWPSTVFCVSVSFFFSEVFHAIHHFLFNNVYFHL
jgi:hypothetical protein